MLASSSHSAKLYIISLMAKKNRIFLWNKKSFQRTGNFNL